MGDDPDKIDQMIWSEIPVEYDSQETEEFLEKYRKSDDHRSHKWKDLNMHEDEDRKVLLFFVCYVIYWYVFLLRNVV